MAVTHRLILQYYKHSVFSFCCHRVKGLKISPHLYRSSYGITKLFYGLKIYMLYAIYIFWDITLCSLLKVSWHFRGTCSLHLQGWRISQVRNQHEAGSKVPPLPCFMFVSCLAYSPTLEKIELLIITAVRSSKPTYVLLILSLLSLCSSDRGYEFHVTVDTKCCFCLYHKLSYCHKWFSVTENVDIYCIAECLSSCNEIAFF
jgi:hypothetical protein